MKIIIRRLWFRNDRVGVIATDSAAASMVGVFLTSRRTEGAQFIGCKSGAYPSLCGQIASRKPFDLIALSRARIRDGFVLESRIGLMLPQPDGQLREATIDYFLSLAIINHLDDGTKRIVIER